MRKLILALTGLALLVLGVGQAKADAFIFGGTGGTPNFLDVTTTSGSFVLSTGTNEINSGANNQGWWSPNDGNSIGNDNFIAGSLLVGPTTFNFNDFFTFDITALAGQTVTGVTLNIQNPGGNSAAGTYSVYDVSTDALTLNNLANNPDASIYNDLGSGNLYGSQSIPLINASQYFIALDASAMNDLQAAINGGSTFFSTGGTFTAVPEPSTIVVSSILFSTFGLVVLGSRLMKTRMAV